MIKRRPKSIFRLACFFGASLTKHQQPCSFWSVIQKYNSIFGLHSKFLDLNISDLIYSLDSTNKILPQYLRLLNFQ